MLLWYFAIGVDREPSGIAGPFLSREMCAVMSSMEEEWGAVGTCADSREKARSMNLYYNDTHMMMEGGAIYSPDEMRRGPVYLNGTDLYLVNQEILKGVQYPYPRDIDP